MFIITRKNNLKKFVKKGDITMVFVVVMILTVLVLVVLLYPQYNILNWFSGKTPYNICRISVEDASLMRFRNIDFSSNLKCQTQEYTIDSKDVDTARRTVADAMYNCFYQFGQGKVELFTDEGLYCFICSTIDFEGKGAELKELPEFQKFLFENKPLDARVSYKHYLNPSGFKQEKIDLEKANLLSLPLPAQKMAVIFAYGKEKIEEQDVFTDYLLSFTGVLGPVITKYLGDYKHSSQISLAVPYSAEELKSKGCTTRIAQKAQ